MTRKIPIISLEDFEAKAKKPLMMKTLVTDLEQEISELTLEVIGYYGIPFQDTTYGSNEPPIGDECVLAILAPRTIDVVELGQV